jgi:hypothetical protein
MDSNTHSNELSDGLTALAAVVDQLAAEHRAGLPAPVRVDRVLGLGQLMGRLDGHWLAELAAVDAAGAAGADHGVQVASTAGWLRQRLRMSAGAAHRAVGTARALFAGPSAGPARPCWPASSPRPTPPSWPPAPRSCPPG